MILRDIYDKITGEKFCLITIEGIGDIDTVIEYVNQHAYKNSKWFIRRQGNSIEVYSYKHDAGLFVSPTGFWDIVIDKERRTFVFNRDTIPHYYDIDNLTDTDFYFFG